MRDKLLSAAFDAVLGIFIVLGSLAAIDPVRFPELWARIADPRSVPPEYHKWVQYRDPDVIRRSRALRLEIRIMGIAFVLGASWIIIATAKF